MAKYVIVDKLVAGLTPTHYYCGYFDESPHFDIDRKYAQEFDSLTKAEWVADKIREDLPGQVIFVLMEP